MCAGFAQAQQPFEEAELIASDGDEGDNFGTTVAIDNSTAVVGASSADVAGILGAGSAYVFVRFGRAWSEQQELTPSTAQSFDAFGSSVDLEGDTAVVGTEDGQAAYVFVRQGTAWSEQAVLTGPPGLTAAFFGSPVALSGDTIVVGSAGDSAPGTNAIGAAYVFVRSGASWSLEAELFRADTADNDNWEYSLAIAGDTIVVGVPNGDPADLVDAGEAYVFARSSGSWSLKQKLTAGDPGPLDAFGISVALEGDTTLIGSYNDEHLGSALAGSAYVFTQSGGSWSQGQKLVASNVLAADFFGTSVAISGDLAVIGAIGSDFPGLENAGSAYFYARQGATWSETAQVTGSTIGDYDEFGNAVAVAGDTAVVGAHLRDAAGSLFSGSAYVFRLCQPASSYCTAGTSASGCQALLSASGTASASAVSGFSLLAAGVEGAKDGLFFFGTNGRQANSWGNGTSFQCVAPPVSRAGLLAGSGTIGQCNGTFAQDLNALWCPSCPKLGKNPGAGAVVQAQLWYRDPLATSSQTTSLSDAIEFCVGP